LRLSPKNIILVVEDEPIIVRMATVALSTVGFRAAVAENGVAGLECYVAMKDEICLVLSDIMMPISTGVELADKIREREPDAKILLMSGYSDNELVKDAQNRYPFIRKPFLPDELIRKIRFVLGPDDPTAD
jgi:two-component system cell cycle sensor histidine kinase/response regulator CckA